MSGVVLLGYLLYLDRLITETFEQRRWSVPAIVYAQPVELYPGAVLRMPEIIEELERLGYQPLANLRHPGSYKRTGNALSIYLRGFQFIERSRDSQKIELNFDSAGLKAITDVTGRPVPLIRLDPLNIGNFYPTHGEDRLVLSPEAVPDLLEDALKVVEDEKFESHHGFDLKGIARAAWVNISAGKIKQGGSTLTQQLVKSYYLDNRRTFQRKFREIAMAIILELHFSKEDLLNAYINEIHLGQDGARAVHGFGLGSQFYFNKPLGELRSDELATLIAIIRGPSYYNPYRHPQRLTKRRNLVLQKMRSAELISDAEYQRGVDTPLRVVIGARSGGAYYPAFMDMVRSSLADLYMAEDLTTDGLRVFTTLSPRSQDAAEMAMSEAVNRLEVNRQLPIGELQGAVVIANTQTGEIEAIAGSRTAGVDGYNRALNANRPVGSLLKPVVYLSALERGYNLASEIQDAAVNLPMQGGEPWTPGNFDGEVHGAVPLARALGDSLNLATINLGLSIGVDQIAARLEALTGRPVQNHYPSLLLGAESMTPVEVLGLYSTFASGGFYMQPKSVITVLNEGGAPVTQHPFMLEQRIEPYHAMVLNRALQIVMTQGTGKTSRFSHMGVSGKTGTSDDYRDSWFVGYDNTRLAVVWLGYDDNRPTGLTGASGALRVWDAIFGKLSVDTQPSLRQSDWVEIEYTSGLLANSSCAEVVSIQIPTDVRLQPRPGCGIDFRHLGERIRRNIRDWFN